MKWSRAELARMIDHTLLDPAATKHDVLMACEIARRNQCATVCLNSNRVALAAPIMAGSHVGIAAVVGFPFGAAHMGAKAYETRVAIHDGGPRSTW
jgi:deoxyribose-phosphate aldolase